MIGHSYEKGQKVMVDVKALYPDRPENPMHRVECEVAYDSRQHDVEVCILHPESKEKVYVSKNRVRP